MLSTTARRPVPPLLLAGALLLLAVNLRLSIASVPPVLDAIRGTLGLSSAEAGVLTMLPVLCMGAFAPLAPRLARLFGDEQVLLAAVVLLAGGVLIRLVPGAGALYTGTFVASLAIALLNVLTPAVIKRDFARPGRIMAFYSTTLTAGAALAAGLTVPLAHALASPAGGAATEHGWRPALAIWAAPAAVAALVWAGLRRRAATVSTQPGSLPGPTALPWRSRLAWRVTAYMALQSFLFYAFISWVPDVLRDAGESEASAGGLLSLSLLCGLPASMLVPLVAERSNRAGPSAIFAATCWAAGLAGLLWAASTAPLLWMVLVGVAQGSTLALALTTIVMRAGDRSAAAALSGMAQSVGYLIAALGPLLVGLLHSATGGWSTPLTLLLFAALVSARSGGGSIMDARSRRPCSARHTESSLPSGITRCTMMRCLTMLRLMELFLTKGRRQPSATRSSGIRRRR